MFCIKEKYLTNSRNYEKGILFGSKFMLLILGQIQKLLLSRRRMKYTMSKKIWIVVIASWYVMNVKHVFTNFYVRVIVTITLLNLTCASTRTLFIKWLKTHQLHYRHYSYYRHHHHHHLLNQLRTTSTLIQTEIKPTRSTI